VPAAWEKFITASRQTITQKLIDCAIIGCPPKLTAEFSREEELHGNALVVA